MFSENRYPLFGIMLADCPQERLDSPLLVTEQFISSITIKPTTVRPDP
jgi:hypothetical protein